MGTRVAGRIALRTMTDIACLFQALAPQAREYTASEEAMQAV